MDVIHDSSFEAELNPILDKDGSEARVVIVKATFDLLEDGSLSVAEKQAPIRSQNVYIGEPGKSSVLYESDGALFKPSTDMVVIGSAFSPTGRPVKQLGIGLQIGEMSRELIVFGDRVWNYGTLGVSLCSPRPFVEMPICWERCFGGADLLDADPNKHAWEQRNPIGTGFRVTKSRKALDGLALPNFENPRALLKNWDDKPSPVGLGYVGRSWTPRIRYAGTFDQEWQRNRMPVLPKDFDYRFFNAAPIELMLPGYVKGGETIRLTNLTKRGLDAFRIPKILVVFEGYAKRRRLKLPANLDTIEIRTVERQLVLTWRQKYPVLLNEPADSVVARIERFD